jgi:alkanesulfonate monooxygenase SsuD/methylene tetrahydromethanopterin reductase-like flavin-dependent oxidoreductase (luciferase family)
MTDIQFGFCMPGDYLDKEKLGTYVHDLNQALHLVAGYFDSAWTIDHLQFGNEDILEGFTTLAFTTVLHPQLKFGNTVLCQSFRNPALLAKMGATLQFLSGGRFILGIGAGWHEEAYQAYGYAFLSDGVRVSQLEEALRNIKSMWVQEKATFNGQYFQIRDAFCEPKPEPIPPIIVGGKKRRMLRLAASAPAGTSSWKMVPSAALALSVPPSGPMTVSDCWADSRLTVT